jgi:hypothetical protein
MAFNRRTDMNKAPIEPVAHGFKIVEAKPQTITIVGKDALQLLAIHPDGTVEGLIENASEAARIFVESIRHHITRTAPASSQQCPGCGGLNTSCPEGCGRDPATGELDGSTYVAPSQHSELADIERARQIAAEVVISDYPTWATDEIKEARRDMFRRGIYDSEHPVKAAFSALRQSPDTARVDALEEAAKVADNWGVGHPHIATAIRALAKEPT